MKTIVIPKTLLFDPYEVNLLEALKKSDVGIILDFNDVSLIDSIGLTALETLNLVASRLEKKIFLSNVNDEITFILKLASIYDSFEHVQYPFRGQLRKHTSKQLRPFVPV